MNGFMMDRGSEYADLERQGLAADLPTDEAALHRLALEVICSRGVPSHLTPYGSIRAVAAFAIGATDDPYYNDGRVLLRAAVADRAGQEAQ